MEGRVIASFRAIGGPGRPFLERAVSLIQRFTDPSLGGVHVGWDVLKLTFAFAAADFPRVLDAVTTDGPETQGEEPPWAIGLAQGDIRTVNEPGSALTASGLLWWGPPIVAASALAGLARPGEILCAQTIPALRAGELVTSGLRIARDGTLRVRGARLDRRQPWKRQAAENLGRLVEPRLVSAHLPSVKPEPGALVVLRADPGAGGTRFLDDLASRASRALVISKAGSGFEPLGALRRALGRSVGQEMSPMLLELAAPLEALLSGRGVSLDMAAQLITAFLWPKQSGTNGAIILDDAKWVDPGTLEACVRAVRRTPAFGIVARLDATGGLPSVLAALPKASEHEIGALSREGAEDVAAYVTGGALDAMARGRWAKLGGKSPLAIVEAITHGIANGDITWVGDRATPRSRAAGRGKARTAAKWIRARANAERTQIRVALSLLAVCGGEAKVSFLSRVLENASLRVDAAQTIAYMQKSRWVVTPQEGWVAFPSRTHQSALFSTLEGEAKQKLHFAVARTIEETDGVFGRVEGAWHAVQGGESSSASAALLAGAKAAGECALEASTTQLIALARRADPGCEAAALELLSTAIARAPSVMPPPVSGPSSMSPVTMPSAPPSAVVSSAPLDDAVALAAKEAAPGRRMSAPPPAKAGPAAPLANFPPLVPDVPGVPKSEPKGALANKAAQAKNDAPDGPDAGNANDAGDEPDSMIEHARIVAPSETIADSRRGPPSARGDVAPAPAPALAPAPESSREPPPTRASIGVPASGSRPPMPESAPGSQIALRLGELAKDALLAADNAALERWVDGLRATGESPAFTDRMRAMARLGRGDIGDALRVLRKARSQLDPSDHRRRCQTSLAIGVALSAAGRSQEALLEGMDALARARQIGDDRGAKACLAFLAKLYSSVSREAEAETLRAAST